MSVKYPNPPAGIAKRMTREEITEKVAKSSSERYRISIGYVA